MRITKTSYKVVGLRGTSLITTFQIKGLRLRKKVLVRSKRESTSGKKGA